MLNTLKKPLLIRSIAVCSTNHVDCIDVIWLHSKIYCSSNIELRLFAENYFKKNPEKIPIYKNNLIFQNQTHKLKMI